MPSADTLAMPAAGVIIVDPISTGGLVAFEAYLKGYGIIAVWSSDLLEELRSHVPDLCKTEGFAYCAELVEKASIEDTAVEVRAVAERMNIEVVACMVGGESGVTLADKLSSELKLRSNGLLPAGDRRNKHVQQELVHAAGLRAVRESLGTTWSDVTDFVDHEEFPIVLKPVESAGSDGVKLCSNKQEAEEHFQLLMDSQRVNGGANAGVICQEFLKGEEYVIDHVSRDGVHKTVMVWVYDKRATNGAAFVYYGMIPVDSSTVEAQILIKYTREVLDVLGLANGPTHAEVMLTSSGPCLVEMNCRTHGWMGGWVPLAKAMTGGYAQPGVALDSYLNADAFASIPDVTPTPFKATGQTVMLVSFFEGIVLSTPGYDRIRQLPSFVALQTDIVVGSKVELTVDLATAIGVLVLANSDKETLHIDLCAVRTMEKEGLFILTDHVHSKCLKDSTGDEHSTQDDCSSLSESGSLPTSQVSAGCEN